MKGATYKLDIAFSLSQMQFSFPKLLEKKTAVNRSNNHYFSQTTTPTVRSYYSGIRLSDIKRKSKLL